MEEKETSDWLKRRRESNRKAARKLRAKRQALADAFYKVRGRHLSSRSGVHVGVHFSRFSGGDGIVA